MPERSLDDPRRHVQVLEERVGAVSSNDFPGHYPGEDHTWNLDKFRESLELPLNTLTPTTISFDMVGVDASVANALRRCLISEIPTLAIDKVYVYNNTSIMHDEVLAHRLGLLPIKMDPRKMTFRSFEKDANDSTDENTLVFQIWVKCASNQDAPRDATHPSELYIKSSVLSSDLEWKPEGNQLTRWRVPSDPHSLKSDGSEKGYKQENRPRCSMDDILLVKMRPGQEVHALLHCQKGTGKIHAKWSPVATASYRILPHIRILRPIPGHLAEKFQNCFPPGVIELEYDEATEENTKVVVANPRLDTVSREVLRHPEFKDMVELSRIRDHFIFSIESTGAYVPEDLLPEAIGIMQAKISAVEASLMKQYSRHAPALVE